LEGLRVKDVLFRKTRIGNRSGRIEIRFLEVPISGKVVEVLLLAVFGANVLKLIIFSFSIDTRENLGCSLAQPACLVLVEQLCR
jgi:hypothetical protein